MKFSSGSFLFATVGVFCINASIYAQNPNPNDIVINQVTHGGSGCPQGTVGSYISSDGQAMTLTFDQYTAEIGRGIPRAESRKFCNIGVELSVPHGYQFSIFQVDYRGFIELERGLQASLTSLYRFSGRNSYTEDRRFTNARFIGAVSGNYIKRDDIPLETLVWSPCNETRAVNIQSEVRLSGQSGRSGMMTVDTIDAEVQQIYRLKWRRCGGF